jgi:hypothetical protein
MLKLLFTFLFSSTLFLSPLAEAERLVGGIQVNEPSHEKWIESVQEAGLNTIAVTSYAHQGDWNSSNLWFNDPEENVIDEIRRAKKAGLKVVLILRVAIDHAFEKNRFLWHGMIMPKSDSELDEWFKRYHRFVASWTKIAEREGVDVLGVASEMNSMTTTTQIEELPGLHHYYLDEEQTAERRAKIQAEISSARDSKSKPQKSFADTREEFEGSVLAHRAWAEETSYFGEDTKVRINKINQRRKRLLTHWKSVIAEARKTFSGKLTYAANFDQYHEVEFWKDLDILGINAYFKLRDAIVPDDQLYQALFKGWSQTLEQIHAFKKEKGILDKRTIFTELGFRFRKNSTIQPWAMDGFALVNRGAVNTGETEEQELIFWEKEPIDFSERAMAIIALRNACSAMVEKYDLKQRILDGLLYWKLSSIPSHLEVEPFVHILNSADDQLFGHELKAFRQ